MKNLTPKLRKELFPDNLVLMAYRGSVAHNMYIPNTDPNSVDDIDLMGVYMAPKEYYIGLGNPIDVDTKVDYRRAIDKFVGKYDVVSYEFRKFVNMLLKSNPNVLGMLWLNENHYLKKTEAGQLLIDNRALFVSTLAYQSFTGYSYSQLKKIKHGSNKGYMGEKRKELVKKFGFDPKMASHSIRLLRMGMEFLTTGELNVAREDASQLLEIKRGEWTLEQVKNEAQRLFNLTDEAYIRSKLPTKPDYVQVEKIVMEVISSHIMKEVYVI